MELEELKSSWNVLSGELEKQKLVNECVVKSMVKNKGDGALNSLIFYEGLGCLITLLLLAPLGLFFYYISHSVMQLSIYLVVAGILFAWQAYKYYHLKRIHMDELSICKAYSMINSYREWIIREIIGTPFFVIPYYFLINWGQVFNITIFLFTMSFTVICVVFIYRMYIRRIRIVRQSVEELKVFTIEEENN